MSNLELTAYRGSPGFASHMVLLMRYDGLTNGMPRDSANRRGFLRSLDNQFLFFIFASVCFLGYLDRLELIEW